jgi:predicted MFS family arabinose efflux permease
MVAAAMNSAPPSLRRSVLLAFQAAFFAISLNLVIIAPLLPELALGFERPVGELGVLVTAFALPYALLAPLLGPASERLGRRALLLAGMGCFALGQGVAVVAPSLVTLLVARALVGLGAAAFSPAAYAYLGDHSPPGRRAQAISAVLLAASFGSIVGLPLGGLAVSAAGWRGAFGLLGLLALTTLLVLIVTLEPDRPTQVGRGYVVDLVDVARAGGTASTLLVTVLWSAGYNGTLAYIGALIAERYGLASGQIAILLSGLGIAGLIGNRLGAWLGARLGDRWMLVAAIACLLLAVLLLPLTAVAPAVTVAVAGLMPAAVQFGWPALLSIVSELAPRARATALALNSSAYYLGGAIGPPLVGLAVGRLGIGGMGPPALAAIGLALLLAVLTIARPHRRLAASGGGDLTDRSGQ